MAAAQDIIDLTASDEDNEERVEENHNEAIECIVAPHAAAVVHVAPAAVAVPDADAAAGPSPPAAPQVRLSLICTVVRHMPHLCLTFAPVEDDYYHHQ